MMDEKQMEDQAPEEQAKQAIGYALKTIRDNPSGAGWFMGLGSQAFSLLTEAYATLKDTPVKEVRENFAPRNGKRPSAVAIEALEAVNNGYNAMQAYADKYQLPDAQAPTICRHAYGERFK